MARRTKKQKIHARHAYSLTFVSKKVVEKDSKIKDHSEIRDKVVKPIKSQMSDNSVIKKDLLKSLIVSITMIVLLIAYSLIK